MDILTCREFKPHVGHGAYLKKKKGERIPVIIKTFEIVIHLPVEPSVLLSKVHFTLWRAALGGPQHPGGVLAWFSSPQVNNDGKISGL